MCCKWPQICSTCKYFPVLSSFTTYYGFVTRLTWRVPLEEHLSSTLGFYWVHVTRSLVLYVCFLDRCLSFCTFSFGHCVVCSSSIWYLQTLLLEPWKSLLFTNQLSNWEDLIGQSIILSRDIWRFNNILYDVGSRPAL